jgi:hypothetical protein
MDTYHWRRLEHRNHRNVPGEVSQPADRNDPGGTVLPARGAEQSMALGICTPGYRPCIANRASDVDRYGGSGNGPRYTSAGVVYRVRGADRYGLDADNDGRGLRVRGSWQHEGSSTRWPA